MNIKKFQESLAHIIAREVAETVPPHPGEKVVTPTRSDAEKLMGDRTLLQRAQEHMSIAHTAAEHIARHWHKSTDEERRAAIERIANDPKASLYPPDH